MKIIDKLLPIKNIDYPIEKLYEIDKILFLDIETTGFTAKNSNLYLIGCAYFHNNTWNLKQWFCENPEDEQNVLHSFLDFLNSYEFIIHFNGNNFDIPYLAGKADQYNVSCHLSNIQGLDLYRRISPFKFFLKLPNCKQKTLESFLEIERDDQFNGGELIQKYHEYLLHPDANLLELLLLHNAEDMEGMIQLLPLLSYSDLFTDTITVKKVQANYYKDFYNQMHQELVMKLSFESPLPKAISYYTNGCYFTGDKKEGSLKVPLYEEEMKYYYSNYQDYYYLPEEDIAIHKSVASYVDKDFRKQATAATCYTRKKATYLPQWELLFTPFFKRDYKSKNFFFELTEDFKTKRSAFSKYAEHILQMMVISR